MTEPSDLREHSIEVVRRLRQAGHVAFWAGGCVRDYLRGVPPKDYDVATDARPEQVRRLFARTVAVGESFGVIRVIAAPGDIEVATFRADGRYSDGRHPDSVEFSSPEQDALRRDFTINGMFFDPVAKQVIDYVGGQADLSGRVVRAIGEPRARFREDKLRLLRAVRFAANLGFSIDPRTAEAVRQMAPEISEISRERVLMELRGMLVPPTRDTALALLREFGLFAPVLPHIAAGLADEAWHGLLAIESYWKSEVSLPLALAALVSHLPGPVAAERMEQTFIDLRGSNDERARAVWLCRHREELSQGAQQRLAIIKRLLAHPGVHDLIDLVEANEFVSEGRCVAAAYVRGLAGRLSRQEIEPPILLSGDDLVAAGYRPGPAFKQVLTAIRDEQLEGLLGDKEAALSRARELFEPGKSIDKQTLEKKANQG